MGGTKQINARTMPVSKLLIILKSVGKIIWALGVLTQVWVKSRRKL